MHRERRLLSLGERLQVCLGTFLGRLSFLLGAAVLLALGNQECPGVQLEVRGEVCTGEGQMVPTTMRWLCLNHGGLHGFCCSGLCWSFLEQMLSVYWGGIPGRGDGVISKD